MTGGAVTVPSGGLGAEPPRGDERLATTDGADMAIKPLKIYISKKLQKSRILRYLKELDEELRKVNVKGEITLIGGTVMVLAFDARPATKDVDAIFKPVKVVQEAAEKVAKRNGLTKDWLNDDGRLGETDVKEKMVYLTLPNLVIYVPTMEYMLVMKCFSARLDGTDRGDLKFLIKNMGITIPEKVFNIITKHYPRSRIDTRLQFFIEAILDDINRC